ncbi:MAG TPA: hypothetical protein VLX92_02545 [Kofleriaceae bacterium]|nr:hypothetical protein [Kofleriaceae bacterium]
MQRALRRLAAAATLLGIGLIAFGRVPGVRVVDTFNCAFTTERGFLCGSETVREAPAAGVRIAILVAVVVAFGALAAVRPLRYVAWLWLAATVVAAIALAVSYALASALDLFDRHELMWPGIAVAAGAVVLVGLVAFGVPAAVRADRSTPRPPPA